MKFLRVIFFISVIEVATGEYEADEDKLTAAASCLGRNTFTSAIIGTQREYLIIRSGSVRCILFFDESAVNMTSVYDDFLEFCRTLGQHTNKNPENSWQILAK